MFLSVGVWYYLEYVFLLIGVITHSALLLFKRIRISKYVVWIVFTLVAPIVSFGAHIMVGRALFLRTVPVRSGSIEDPALAEPPYLPLAGSLTILGAGDLSRDSTARYISDGNDYFESLFRDIENAREIILIEYYLIRRDPLSEHFLRILCKKACEGIETKILFDDFGYDGKDFGYVHMLESSGAECKVFHNMTRQMFSPKKNYRDHRKIAVIDGCISYIGGYNIGEEYLNKGHLGTWKDSALRIEGPQVRNITRSFMDMWEYVTGTRQIYQRPMLPLRNVPDPVPMMFVPGIPIQPEKNPVLTQMLQMIDTAEHSVFIATPYFIPPNDLLAALCHKASEGVRVDVVIPSIRDHIGVYWANRRYAYTILKSGGSVYEHTGGFLHSKVLICDDKLCSVGTSNFDERSINLNFECNMLLWSEELSTEILDDLTSQTKRYTAAQYEARNTYQKVCTILSSILRKQL